MERLSNKERKGFSLAEALMATVVLAMAAAGVILPFASGAAVREEGMRRTLAARLASDLMEEVIRTPFDQIMAGYNYTEAQGQVKDAMGVVFAASNYAKFSRDVSSVYVNVPQESGAGAPPKFIRAIVRVYYDGEQIAVMNRLIASGG